MGCRDHKPIPEDARTLSVVRNLYLRGPVSAMVLAPNRASPTPKSRESSRLFFAPPCHRYDFDISMNRHIETTSEYVMSWFTKSDHAPKSHRRHRHRGHHHHHSHTPHDRGHHSLPAEVDEIPPDPVAANHIRLFTCVARHCCQGKDGRQLLAALRQAAAESGAAIDVKACGCLDQCDDGPVVIAHRGTAARGQRPPEGTLSRLLHRPVGRFTDAQPHDANRIVESLTSKQR